MTSDSYIMHYSQEEEETAEEVLESKERIVVLNCRRDKNREALRVLYKEEKEAPSGKKSWLCFGNMFIKAKNSNIKHILEKDQENISAELGKIYKDLKPKVKKLYEMEGKELPKGFDLNPLDKNDPHLHGLRQYLNA